MRRTTLWPEAIWLAVVILAIGLTSRATINGRFVPEEGLLWGWSVGAFGIVASLSLLVGAQRTRARTVLSFLEAFFGAMLVDMILGAHVNELNAPEVGEIEGVLNFFSHCLVIGAMGVIIVLSDAPRRQRVLRPLYVFATGAIAVAAFGMMLSRSSHYEGDSMRTIHGIARADMLGKMAGSLDRDRKPIKGGMLYKVYDWGHVHYVIVTRGDDFMFEVPLPFPDSASSSDAIIRYVSRDDVRERLHLPRRDWEITWAGNELEPYTQPTLIFRLRRPLEQVNGFGVEMMLDQATRTSVALVNAKPEIEKMLSRR